MRTQRLPKKFSQKQKNKQLQLPKKHVKNDITRKTTISEINSTKRQYCREWGKQRKTTVPKNNSNTTKATFYQGNDNNLNKRQLMTLIQQTA